MKTIKDLTPEIRAKIEEYKNKATKDLYSGKERANFDRKKANDYIEMVYNIAKQDKPITIFATDPAEYRVFFELLQTPKFQKIIQKLYHLKNKKILKNSELRSELANELNSEVNSELRRELYIELDNELDNELRNKLDSELHNELYNELHNELSNELNSELRSELANELNSEVNSELRRELRNELYIELDNELRNELDSELSNELHNELSNELDSELRSELANELNSEVNSELRRELRNELNPELSPHQQVSQIIFELSNELYIELDNELRNELDSELSNELSKKLGNELNSELNKYKIRSHWLTEISCYSRVYFMWYYFINKELGVPTSNPKRLKKLYEDSNNGIMRSYFTKGYVLSLIAPEKIERNERGFNSVDGQAIKYAKGGLFYINDTLLPSKYFNAISSRSLTPEQFFKEKNADTKAAMIGMMQQNYGEQFIIDFFKEQLKEIDNYVDKKDAKYLMGTTNGMSVGVYTLFKGVINEVEVAYVRCYCPSTDRMFYLGVHPDNTSAKDAIASLYRVPKKLVNNIKYIQRQGERFSTVFDDEGKEIVKTLKKQDYQNTTNIKGSEYFKLMRYEY